MNNDRMPIFEVLDCTIRDGGYLNNWRFDIKMVREVYRALSKAGVDIVEIGFRGTEKYFERNKFGPWRFTDIEDLKTVIDGINGARIAIMGDFGKLDLDEITDEYRQYVDIIRIASHKNETNHAIKLLEKIKEKGFKVSLNAMGITSYTDEETEELKKMLNTSDIDYFYIADSYGSLMPGQTKHLIETFKEISHLKIGFHPHNSLQMAFANTIQAIQSGADVVDSTIFGIGRAAGNLQTEVLLSYLQSSTTDKYNVIPVLSCIDRFFMNLEVDEPWGYQLPYMLSGIFKCHPYYPKTLVDYRIYSMEDVWNALEIVSKKDPVGFSKDIIQEIVDSGVLMGGHQEVKTRKEKIFNTEEDCVDNKNDSQEDTTVRVSYINRHTKRDFLIVANGPSLKEYGEKINAFIKRYDPVIIGGNYLAGLIKPHYHAFNNKKRFVDYVDTVSEDSVLLIGQNITDSMVREYTKRDYETLYFVDELNPHFDIVNGEIQTNCGTIAVLTMGVAIVMGSARVFAVGMDGYAGIGGKDRFHFYKEKVEPEEQDLITERQRLNQKFLEEMDQYLIQRGQEGIHIITPTSHKSFYKGIENYL
jgi:4-hydroxy 2-oxovalerate aldolase